MTESPQPLACAALVTPRGRGAIATVAVSGQTASRLVAACFHSASPTPLDARRTTGLAFGRWLGECGEEVVVSCQADDWVEVHCHGGAAAADAILQSLAERGCTTTEWQSLAGVREPNSLAAEARQALAQARTTRAAAILLDQYRGALASALQDIVARLRAGACHAAQTALAALQQRSLAGVHLVQPWRVVLAGRPNVGKSSLLNALLGYRRAIVHERAGTTRDVLSATTAIDGWLVHVDDTAGLREADEAIEQEGIRRARAALARADCLALVFDATQRWTALEDALVEHVRPDIIVHNKCDLAVPSARRPAGLWTSALTGENLDQLQSSLVQRLNDAAPPEGAAVPFTESHRAAVTEALARLASGQPQAAADVLEEILG